MSKLTQESEDLESLTTLSTRTSAFTPRYCGLFTQQQKQPDGGGDCIWPPPQSLVNVTNIILQNVTSDGGWLNAGVLRCAASNPCRGIVFENVTVTGWASSFYTCENVEGKVVDSTPKPACIKSDKSMNYAVQYI